MNSEQIARSVAETWDASIVPTLERYIRIPNQSPLFDPDWKQNGHMHRGRRAGAALGRRAADRRADASKRTSSKAARRSSSSRSTATTRRRC